MKASAFVSRALHALRTPQALPAMGFAAAILIGSVLLWLPWSHQSGSVGYLDALFTSTSAVCVTGLVTLNTATDFTVAGQVIILLLIQIGGLGVMTYAAMAFSLIGRRMSLRSQAALHDSLFQADRVRDFKRLFWQITVITFATELVGTAVLAATLFSGGSVGSALWQGLFHSVSAFCNAGFSIFSDGLMEVRGNHTFTAFVMVLVIVGGLGFMVIHELLLESKRVVTRAARVQARRLTLHADVVLRTSLLLLVGGAALILLFGLTNGERGWGERVEAAVFQSVSARTCGFNTVDIGALPLASLLVLSGLMFIGGSPGSTAGGIKTSTVAVLAAQARSYITGDDQVSLGGRKLSRRVIRSASLLLLLAVAWNLIGVLVLAHYEQGKPGMQFQNLLFEQISAFGTVGLTAGVTAGLGTVGKIWIIATMYVGRLGPLTLAGLAIYRRTSRVAFAEGKVMIG
ncbi:MAG: ATPase [Thermoleophilia bacterium]|nr:ATPase [Thermoleophilia bacterium]